MKSVSQRIAAPYLWQKIQEVLEVSRRTEQSNAFLIAAILEMDVPKSGGVPNDLHTGFLIKSSACEEVDVTIHPQVSFSNNASKESLMVRYD